ncbi:cuticle protein 16.5 [Drosophila ficusphila]|uniref:cuticle protein 16.5 n=1 Tax=Drosophila ficusphila TaxID=30025 RepID=UPI0007E73A71|nr:cuticle protein 16.5 [Drosophila ficusphila]XP_017039576.1 cuticle protein 16.5 [Drosophila ficusphila]
MAFKYVLLSFAALVGVASAGYLAPATAYAAAPIPVVAKVAQPHFDAVGTTQQNVVRSFGGTVSTYSKNVVTPYSSVSKVDSRITNNVYTPKTLYSAPAPVITKSFYAAAPAPVVAKTVYSAPAPVVAKTVYSAPAPVYAAAAPVVTKAVYSAPAPVLAKTVYAAPAPVVAKTVYSAPVAKAVYAAPAPVVAKTVYSAPAPVYSAPAPVYSAPAPVYSAPVVAAAPAAFVKYSPAAVVAHASFDGFGSHWGY